MILNWGKCTIKYAVSEDGVASGDWTELETPKEDTTSLTVTNGTEKTATEEGGAIVAYLPAKNTYDLEFDLFAKKGHEAPFSDEDGVVSGEYAFRIRSQDKDCVAIQIDRAVVRVDISYTSADGTLLHHAVKCLKPVKGNTIKFYTIAPSDLSYEYYDRTDLTTLDLSTLDTSAVTNMTYMFYYCTALTSLDLSGFDTSAVTNMAYMFNNCKALTSLDLSSFDTSAVTDMAYMFNGCSALTSLDLSSFDTSAVTNMSYMFYYCNALTSLDLSGFDTSAVTTMAYMFSGCTRLTSLDLSGFDTSAVTNMTYMFNGCSALTDVTGTISGISVDINLSSCPLTRESALVFLNGLNADTPATISFSSTTKALLTEDDIAIATDKGWTVA